MVKASTHVVHHHIHHDASGHGFKDFLNKGKDFASKTWSKVKGTVAPVVNKVAKQGISKAKDFAVKTARKAGQKMLGGDYGEDFANIAGNLSDHLGDEALHTANEHMGTGMRRRRRMVVGHGRTRARGLY
jgi:hypothetical protein